MLKTGMRIEGTIQSAKRGQGVMRHGKDTIFVRHAMPGDQVRVRIGKPMRDAEAVSSCTSMHKVSSSGKKNRSCGK